jgi:two-component system response regulator NreC
MTMLQKVLIVEDHALIRAGLRSLLDGYLVVAEAGDARTAYQLADEHRPDMAIVDMALPGEDGIAATRELRRRLPEIKVLILSSFLREDLVVNALDAGAIGYALKEQDPATTRQAVDVVARGGNYLSPRISATTIEEHLRMKRRGGFTGPVDRLSPREREIFDLQVRGFNNDQIARELFISPKTVETHRAHIFRKLRVHSMPEMIRLAATHGLVPPMSSQPQLR